MDRRVATRAWIDVRPGEGHAIALASTTLALILASHVLLETARDALFLASVSAQRLPWVYLAITGTGLLLTRFHWPVRAATLSISLVVAAAATIGLWFVVASDATWSLYALYIWSGFYATASVVQLWIYVGAHFTASDGKRLFGLVGTGGIVGAVVGSLAARVVTRVASAEALLVTAAGFMLVAAILPLALRRALRDFELRQSEQKTLPGSVRTALGHRYVRALGLLVLVSMLGLTVADYLFKSIVARNVNGADELGAYFATFYAATNIASLVLQVAIVPVVLRRLGLTPALVLLPALMIGGAFGLVLGGGIIAVSALKGVDGGLRHSMHRTAVEVLYLPLGNRLRGVAKLLIDIVGQRGGQALGSVVILAVIAMTREPLTILSIALVASLVAWLVLAVRVGRENLDMFRRSLAESSVETRIEFPELDISSLETLMSKLNSLNDREVRAAMEVLDESDRLAMIPDLILFHPSANVVLDALTRFRAAGRTSFLPIAEHLVTHGDSEIRAAALLTLDAVGRATDRLSRYRGSSDLWLASAAVVGSISRRRTDWEQARAEVAALRERDDEADFALARSAALASGPLLIPLLAELADSRDPRARLSVVNAARALRSARLVKPLLHLLGERFVRDALRQTFVETGDEALAILGEAMADTELPARVRDHLPRSISRFATREAFSMLFAAFPDETSSVVRYKILRGLGRLVDELGVAEVERETVDALIASEVGRAVQVFGWRHRLAGADGDLAILVELLGDIQARTLEVVFRLLGLREPDESLEDIHRGLASADVRLRSSARELLTNLLEREADPVLVLLDDVDDAARAATLGFTDAPFAPRDVVAEIIEASVDPLLAQVARECLEDLEVATTPGEPEKRSNA